MKAEHKEQIKKTLHETKARRHSMTCKVIECKVDRSVLSRTTIESLNKLFLESKWFYNSLIASGDLNNYDTKATSVQVKVLDNFEARPLEVLSSQMKQGIKARTFAALSALHTLKSNGRKVGSLKFKSEVKSIPLKQHNNTFTILKSSKRIKIQGLKQLLKVHGLNQLPKDCEIGSANLTRVGDDFFVKITVFVTKEQSIAPDKSVGIDFGCTTQLTLSTGEKIAYQIPISKRIKKLDQSRAKKVKHSKNYNKVLRKREKAYQRLINQKQEIKNQIVSKLTKTYKTICFQDESISAWKASGHGKKIQFSAIGGIISALQRKAVTPVVVRKHFPSTQLCSHCGNRQTMSQWERVYLCKACGVTIDRDVNSAVNIEKEGLASLVPAERREVKPVETGTSVPGLLANLDKVPSLSQETQPSLVVG
jgi:putative transposase